VTTDRQHQKTKPTAASVVPKMLGIAAKKLDKLVDPEESDTSFADSDSSCESGDFLDVL